MARSTGTDRFRGSLGSGERPEHPCKCEPVGDVRTENGRAVKDEHRSAQLPAAGDRERDRERQSEDHRASRPRATGQQIAAFERDERERPENGSDEHEDQDRDRLLSWRPDVGDEYLRDPDARARLDFEP